MLEENSILNIDFFKYFQPVSLRFNFPKKFHLLKFGCTSMTSLLRPSIVGMDAFPNLEFAVKCVRTGLDWYISIS